MGVRGNTVDKMDENDIMFLNAKFETVATQIAGLEKEINKLNQSFLDYQKDQKGFKTEIYNKLNPLVTEVGKLSTTVEGLVKEDKEINTVIKDFAALKITVDNMTDDKKTEISKKQFLVGLSIPVILTILGLIKSFF